MQIIEILTDWRVILQIAIIFVMIYLALYYLRNTQGSLVMTSLLMIISTLSLLAKLLDLDVISKMMELIFDSSLLVLMIIFQPELRRALASLVSIAIGKKRRREELTNEVYNAILNMARRKCGAIVVIECKVRLQSLIDDAVELDAKVNSFMLESIFFPNSPLHDGAVIIRGERIVAARAILPLSRSENISRRLGTRHRAALGISEESDAVTILVSEESGSISIAHDGKFYRDLSSSDLHEYLDKLIVQNDAEELEETVIQLNEQESIEDDQTPVNNGKHSGGSL